MTDYAAIKSQIASILADAGIAATFKHVPTTYDPRSKEWQHIAWSVEFSSPRGKFRTSYNQGIGHLPKSMQPPFGKGMTVEQVERIRYSLSTGKLPGSFSGAMLGNKPLPRPEVADVVGALISDASAADYATFEDWAADMGSDPDSREAEKTFNLCRNTALNLNRVFGPLVVEQLKPLTSEL